MSLLFQTKKQKILEQLNVPQDDYTDASPKGSVDEGIRELVDEINAHESLVTTSSCAGRVVLYLEGPKRQTTGLFNESVSTAESITASAGGKGGGKWLFVSHEPVQKEIDGLESLCAADSGVNFGTAYAGPSPVDQVRLLHCKFEPMILHVLAASLPTAQRVLTAAQDAGFRESGISSITTAQDGNDQMVMVAIRTHGLSFDSYVGQATPEGTITPLIPPSTLKILVSDANRKFGENTARTQRFRNALKQRFDPTPQSSSDGAWEPIEERRARMKAEGLRRQAESRGEASPSVNPSESDSISYTLFTPSSSNED